MLRNLFGSIALGALLAGCSSPSPSTSSSSHWVTCKVVDDCSDVPNAAACTSGYCVDPGGSRISTAALTSTDGGSCDPLAPKELPVKLGTILGIGTAPDGTTYMADEITEPSTINRVFVSDGNTLVRKQVGGTGSQGVTNGTDYNFSFDGATPDESLLISVRDGKTTVMGLGTSGKSFPGDPEAVTTPLVVKDSSILSTFTLKNLPGEVTIEYVADVDDGSVIVVTHPKDDYSYDDFRLFWGSRNVLVERVVTNVSRARSGSTTIDFVGIQPQRCPPGVSCDTYELSLPFVFAPLEDGGTNSHPDPGQLTSPLVTNPRTIQGVIQRFPTPTMLPGVSFTCR